MGEIRRLRDAIGWIEPPAGWFRNALAALSLRHGGVSPPPFEGLNLGRSTGDDLDRVSRNELLLARALGLPGDPARAFLAHGASSAVVEGPGIVRGVDGLATRKRGLPLWLTVADCYPVYIESGDWIGLLHCGWKGTLAGAAEGLISLLEKRSATPRRAMRAWIGPGIGACCYPVGDEVACRFDSTRIDRRDGRSHLDLGAAVEADLIGAGLPGQSVDRSRLCTSCNPEIFFSYRRDGARSGRMAAVIWLPTSSGQRSTAS